MHITIYTTHDNINYLIVSGNPLLQSLKGEHNFTIELLQLHLDQNEPNLFTRSTIN